VLDLGTLELETILELDDFTIASALEDFAFFELLENLMDELDCLTLLDEEIFISTLFEK